MNIQKYVDELATKALASDPGIETGDASGPLKPVMKRQAVELWSTAAGRLFLVSDEADASQAIVSLGARRGKIYTAAEARRIIAVNDPEVVAEIHGWKQRFDGVVQEVRTEDWRK